MYTPLPSRSFGRRALTLSLVALVAACYGPRAGSPGTPAVPTLAKIKGDSVGVGYGSMNRRDINGAVSSLDGDEARKSNPRTVSDMLVGRFAGVEVRQLANGGTSILIRGNKAGLLKGSSTQSEPLYVVDGVPQHNGANTLSDLNPYDIKAIDVLKDGAATSVYGSRGANGVILISLRRAH